jgi:hypothetical protein
MNGYSRPPDPAYNVRLLASGSAPTLMRYRFFRTSEHFTQISMTARKPHVGFSSYRELHYSLRPALDVSGISHTILN